MSQAIPPELNKSQALKLIISKGWNWTGPVGGQLQVENCPYCAKGDFKFYVAVSNPEESTRDGLFFCHHGSCNKTGNLRDLQEVAGVRIAGVDSRKEWAGAANTEQEALPNVDLCHASLLGDADAMDYLLNVRGFSQAIIDKQKIGLVPKRFFREAGDVKALMIPYLVNNNIVFAKYRTIPPAPKDFTSATGWDAPLYNGEILVPGLRDVVFVEGEFNTVNLLDRGVANVVGVPGANIKKMAWIETLDNLGDDVKKYILYDEDKAGKKAAQELASRIGIDKCWKMVLPYFEVTVPLTECKLCDDNGYLIKAGTDKKVECLHKRQGKDINEWFQKGGGTPEAFEQLKQNAVLFDVTGVLPSKDALQQLVDELDGKVDLAPTYVTPWKELNALVGFEDGDVIDIVAPEKVGKTTLGINLLDHMVNAYGEDGLVVCLEMTQARLARKWVALVTGFEDTITAPGTPESKAKLIELKAACEKARNVQLSRSADLYFAYPMQWQDDPDSIFKLIKDCIRRYGVKWVMFDNLQKFCDESLKHQGHRTIYLSQLSKRFASIAKDYKVKMVRILQPKRIEKGQTISTNDVDGSSQVAKDCDCMITAWRRVIGEVSKSAYEEESEDFKATSESFEPKMKLTVGLSRYSSGGSCYLYYDGARSLVRSYTEAEQKLTNPNTQNFNGIIPTEGSTQAHTVKLPTENIPI
jgi:DnaB-like helicase C terminal domain/Toprim domain